MMLASLSMRITTVLFLLSPISLAAPTTDPLLRELSSLSSLSPRFPQPDRTRRDLETPVSGLPGCSIVASGSPSNQDAAWAVGTSAYSDGQGMYFSSDCDNHQSGNGHCWHDYFLVGTTSSYGPYSAASGDVNCSGTPTCSQSLAEASQYCQTTTWTAGANLALNFTNFITSKLGLTVTGNGGQSYQNCATNTTTTMCGWTDQSCHTIWSSVLTTTIHGYKRARCNSPTHDPTANMHDTAEDDGVWTHGMMDFDVPLSSKVAYFCNGMCTANYNPGNPPPAPNNGAMIPF